MRLAFFSPLNPERSGISDYSEELLPYLAEEAEIDLVTRGYEPSSRWIKDRFEILSAGEFLRRRDRYDCVLYQIGNHRDFHAYMVPCLREVPGIVVLHDYSLSYLTLGMTIERGDLRSLERILAPAYGAEARGVALKLSLGRMDPYQVSLARPMVEMSTGVIVHNRFAQRKLMAEYPDRRIGIVWHATPIREVLGDPRALREKYGFAKDDFLLVSVSRLAYNKRLDLAVDVLRDLVRDHPAVRLIVVGEGPLGAGMERRIQELGLQRHILRTGWVSSEAYLDYIDMADAAIDLRYPTAGETSGGSLRLLQAGKPIVASAQGFFLELPEDCCCCIGVDSHEEEAIRNAIVRLIQDPGERKRMGEAARAFALANLRREQAAKGYLRFIQEVIGGQPPEAVPWDLPAGNSNGPAAALMKTIHGASRMVQFHRHYGFTATVRRVLRGAHG